MANIMDPEGAIPAAASYLKYGDAPEDFYAALHTYNRVGKYFVKSWVSPKATADSPKTTR